MRAGELIELEELVARNHVLGTGKCERHRARAGGDQHMLGLKDLPVDLDRGRSGKARLAVKGIDAPFREAMFLLLRDGIGEGTLEGDEIGPANPDLAGDAPAAHAPGHVDRLCAADQHLFWIAAAQSTGSPERPVVDDRNRPSRRPHTGARHLRGRAAADDGEIVGFAFAHGRSPSLTLVSRHVVATCRR